MGKKNTHQEKTAADKTAIGFDYQYYYFIYSLLNLKSGEYIGLEVKDDVHIDHADGTQSLIQLKHSIQRKANGEIINLRESDSDLWKTLYNWIKTINDEEDNRSSFEEQVKYIEKTKFYLVTNKSESDNNDFLVNFKSFKEGTINIEDFKKYFDDKFKKEGIYILNEKDEKKRSTREKSNLYIGLKELVAQRIDWLEIFFSRLEIALGEDDIISMIKLRIKEKFIAISSIDDVFSSLDSNLRKDNFWNVKHGDKLIFSFDELYQKYNRCFQVGKIEKLKLREMDITFPEKLEDQIFIKQLEDIEVLCKEDEAYNSDVVEKTTLKLKTLNNLENWKQNGELLSTDIIEIEKEALLSWQYIFEQKHRELKRKIKKKLPVNGEEIVDLGADCFYDTFQTNLKFDGYEMGKEFSHGKYYLLSDRLQLGWRYDWKGRYSFDGEE